jgi:hypothetical protein
LWRRFVLPGLGAFAALPTSTLPGLVLLALVRGRHSRGRRRRGAFIRRTRRYCRDCRNRSVGFVLLLLVRLMRLLRLPAPRIARRGRACRRRRRHWRARRRPARAGGRLRGRPRRGIGNATRRRVVPAGRRRLPAGWSGTAATRSGVSRRRLRCRRRRLGRCVHGRRLLRRRNSRQEDHRSGGAPNGPTCQRRRCRARVHDDELGDTPVSSARRGADLWGGERLLHREGVQPELNGRDGARTDDGHIRGCGERPSHPLSIAVRPDAVQAVSRSAATTQSLPRRFA